MARRRNASTKAPAFPFYARDWMDDERVKLMSLAGRGAYIGLLAHEWLHLSIPDTAAECAAVLGVPEREVAKLWPKLSACFVAHETEPGRFVNRRLEAERELMMEHRQAQAEAGRRGAERRWGSHGDPNAEALANDSPASPSPPALEDRDPPAEDLSAREERPKKTRREKKPDPHAEAIDRVIGRINERTGRAYRVTAEGSRKNIRARLNDGATEADCIAVVDYVADTYGQTEFARFIDPETPFRPSKFEKNLAMAKAPRVPGRALPPVPARAAPSFSGVDYTRRSEVS